MTRAQAGGQQGMNGEWYEGGQFLPSTTLPKMAKRNKKQATRKVEIAPYIWEVAPEGMKSIYSQILALCQWTEWQTELELIENNQPFSYYGISREELQPLVEKWNKGERWTNK